MTIPIKIISKKDMKEIPNQEEVWDSIARPWNTYVVKKIPIVEEFLKSKRGNVIDLGCGTGRNMIKNPDIKYYGVDFSKEQLKHAWDYCQKEGINAKLFKSKIDKLIFRDEMFDYGLFIGSLHCLESEKERISALDELHRVLKPGAEALISVWNSEDARFKNMKGDIYMSWFENGTPYMRYYYLYNKKELIDLLEYIGFKVLQIYELREHDRFSKKNWIIRIKK